LIGSHVFVQGWAFYLHIACSWDYRHALLGSPKLFLFLYH
jgi:hypothetical protein